ncbi:MAG: T9SS type A sorting domain-containing protein, partial [Bacteroidia bacterium]|nr:T9SS type A sorting domain-containing protein [Bacteroidia bacterium]
GNDREDGAYSGSSTVKTIIIETLPTNANLYYNGVLVTLGQTIANYNPTLLTVDPTFNGGGTVVFTYAWKDSAQAKDLSPATVTMPFEGITLSGTVYNDGDGNYDLAVDGTGIGVPDATQLYAYLDSAGIVVGKVTLPPAGTYTFTNVATTTTYNVVISSDNVAITAATPTAANLPTNWISTGEAYGVNNTGNTGIEAGAANSAIAVVTATSNVTAVDFGIDKRPESDDKTATSQLNPGTNVQVQVLALTGTDREDGAYSGTSAVKTIIVETLPTNANLYYNGVLVTLGQTIANYNPTLLTVDPTFNGAGTVTFTYAWKDSAQAKDLSPATVTIPFTGLVISGTIYHDGNGTKDNDVNGTPIGDPQSTQLYAYLVDNGGNIVDKSTVNTTTGAFNFTAVDANSNYTVRISATNLTVGAAAPSSTVLPTAWANVGEDYGTNNAAGTGINPAPTDGLLNANTTTVDITNIQYGIEKTTIAMDKTYLIEPDSIRGLTGWGYSSFSHWIQLNAANGTSDAVVNSSNTAIMPGLLSGSDLEDGLYQGATGASPYKVAFTNIPDSTKDLLVYFNGTVDVKLVPNPSPSDPSYVYWNTANNRYEIPNLVASNLKLYFKFYQQPFTSFQYAYEDAAGIFGAFATYRLTYTIPLPVSISELNCNKTSNGIALKWSLYDLRDAKYIEVMKAGSDLNFSTISTINVSNIDRSKFQIDYSFLDINKEAGNNYYRIDVTTVDGKRISSNVCDQNIHVQFADNSLKLAPNPTANSTSIFARFDEPQTLKIELYDNLGKTIQNFNFEMNSNLAEIPVNLENTTPGVYNIRVTWNGNSQILRVVKQ